MLPRPAPQCGLPAPEVESVEEHLLICAECRDRLTATDAYVVAMCSAAGKITESGKALRGVWADAVAVVHRACRESKIAVHTDYLICLQSAAFYEGDGTGR